MSYCMFSRAYYYQLLAAGEQEEAQSVCLAAAKRGCDWAVAICGQPHGYKTPGGEPSLATGPIIDMGLFWPPCPTPWGPGPRFFVQAVADPGVGWYLKDPDQ